MRGPETQTPAQKQAVEASLSKMESGVLPLAVRFLQVDKGNPPQPEAAQPWNGRILEKDGLTDYERSRAESILLRAHLLPTMAEGLEMLMGIGVTYVADSVVAAPWNPDKLPTEAMAVNPLQLELDGSKTGIFVIQPADSALEFGAIALQKPQSTRDHKLSIDPSIGEVSMTETTQSDFGHYQEIINIVCAGNLAQEWRSKLGRSFYILMEEGSSIVTPANFPQGLQSEDMIAIQASFQYQERNQPEKETTIIFVMPQETAVQTLYGAGDSLASEKPEKWMQGGKYVTDIQPAGTGEAAPPLGDAAARADESAAALENMGGTLSNVVALRAARDANPDVLAGTVSFIDTDQQQPGDGEELRQREPDPEAQSVPFRPSPDQQAAIRFLSTFTLDQEAPERQRENSARQIIDAVKKLTQTGIVDYEETVTAVESIRKVLESDSNFSEVIKELLEIEFEKVINGDLRGHLIPQLEDVYGAAEVLNLSLSDELLRANQRHESRNFITRIILEEIAKLYKEITDDDEGAQIRIFRLCFLGSPLLEHGDENYKTAIKEGLKSADKVEYTPPWVKLSNTEIQSGDIDPVEADYRDLVEQGKWNKEGLTDFARTNRKEFILLIFGGYASYELVRSVIKDDPDKFGILADLMDFAYSAQPDEDTENGLRFYFDRVKNKMQTYKENGYGLKRDELVDMALEAYINVFYFARKDNIIDRDTPIKDQAEKLQDYLNSEEERENKNEAIRYLTIIRILMSIYNDPNSSLFVEDAA